MHCRTAFSTVAAGANGESCSKPDCGVVLEAVDGGKTGVPLLVEMVRGKDWQQIDALIDSFPKLRRRLGGYIMPRQSKIWGNQVGMNKVQCRYASR